MHWGQEEGFEECKKIHESKNSKLKKLKKLKIF